MNLLSDTTRTHEQIYYNDSLYIARHISPPLHGLLSLLPSCYIYGVAEALLLACILYTMAIRLALGIWTTRASDATLKVENVNGDLEKKSLAMCIRLLGGAVMVR